MRKLFLPWAENAWSKCSAVPSISSRSTRTTNGDLPMKTALVLFLLALTALPGLAQTTAPVTTKPTTAPASRPATMPATTQAYVKATTTPPTPEVLLQQALRKAEKASGYDVTYTKLVELGR